MDLKRNKIILTILITSCINLVLSCKKTDKQLFSYIDSIGAPNGSINMKEAIGADYDTAYLFGECITNKDIEMVLGLPYKKRTFLQDSEYKLILLKNHAIVYDERFYCKKVEFFFSKQYEYQKVHIGYAMWSDSIFYTKLKKRSNGEYFYQLSPYDNE